MCHPRQAIPSTTTRVTTPLPPPPSLAAPIGTRRKSNLNPLTLNLNLTIIAKLEYEYPIKSVKGKLKDKFGAAKRRIANAKGEQEPFSVIYGERNTDLHPVSTDEQAARDKFSAIAKLVAARRKNVQKRIADALAFQAQTTYPTLTKYLWSVATAEYLASLEED